MIQIDDAGSGSLLGGTCIGVMRVETGEYCYDIVPLEFYRPQDFKDKKYQDFVIDIVAGAINSINIDKGEPIHVCRGYMFDKLKRWLKANGFNASSTKIEDPLQTIVEKTFEDYTISLGLPPRYIRYTKYPFHFHRLLRWVYADYENRKDLCKTGWSSWQKYGMLPLKISYGSVEKPNYYCLKCGSRIQPGSGAKIIKYITNRVNKVYLHESC
ncbi:MAG: hypothetical protein HPY66_3532 [Firmicutes bacterium]|nr:hypothetical protein [Bacillota bacterium]MDI6706368.1 hypothetical protein [Bacillota bacterium]